ncbi:hypothetical protein GH714_033184 [Hevea brasiliensis]|uniref:Calcium-transporting ATPase n=1 Tax=Hevea brasiliensis TaxID=3981 RepID=A0A6A6L3M0_HEVBR|nr:hypothetical protein GH714_033184 [Hevea brasiliensis]
MERYLNENFGQVKSKYSPEQKLKQWRELCGIVRNSRRRFRFTAHLSKRHEAEALRRSNQEKLRIAILVSKAAFQYIQDVSPSDYFVPAEVKAAGFEICADELGSIVEGHDVKKLKFHGGVNGIAEKLSTSFTSGLSTDNDLLNHRQKVYGINIFAGSEARSFWTFVWEALQDKIFIIDSICAFVSLLLGITMEGWQERAHDAIVIVASISLAVFVTATNDFWQYSQLRNWEKEKRKFMVQVARDGFRQRLSSVDLLPGDIVYLACGDLVPADGLFVSGFCVLLDESNLTGESEPIMVNSENPFLLSGSKVLDGSCKVMVTTVGMRTQWGKLIATLSQGGDDETPLQVKLNGVAAIIGKIGQFFAIVTFAVLMQGLYVRNLKGNPLELVREMFKYFTIAFSIFVIALPEGLPLAMTLNLAFAMKKLMNDRIFIRHLAACETMGLASNICIDMTGTLTTNNMTVVKSYICMNVREVTKNNNASGLHSEIPDSALKLLLQSIFNNTSGEVVVNKDGKLEVLGTPTEIALLDFGLSLGGDFQAERQAAKLVKVEPFNSTKKQMGTVLEFQGKGLRAHCKGASEIVLAACDKVINSDGKIVDLNEASINQLKVTVSQFADESLRTLCLAYMELEDGFSAENPIPASGFTCIAIVAIKDPIRPGVKESVAVCRSAGITVRMVTGDNMAAAKATARECGILDEDGETIEGPDFREKTHEELLQLIPRIQVMAQATPQDKLTLVKHLQTTFNEVVAVTGGGANDASLLHEADIGLAMDISGTEELKRI